jgi:chorismate mutase
MTYEEEVEHLRNKINHLNSEIVRKLYERVEIAKAISEVKRKHRKPVRDGVREEMILDNVGKLAETMKLEAEGVRRVFKEIIELCVRAEEGNV